MEAVIAGAQILGVVGGIIGVWGLIVDRVLVVTERRDRRRRAAAREAFINAAGPSGKG